MSDNPIALRQKSVEIERKKIEAMRITRSPLSYLKAKSMVKTVRGEDNEKFTGFGRGIRWNNGGE